MMRNLEARLDGSTQGKETSEQECSPLGGRDSADARSSPGGCPSAVWPVSLWPSGFAAEIESCDIGDFVFARLGISRSN